MTTRIVSVLALFLTASTALAASKARVVDNAGFFSAGVVERANQRLEELDQK